MRTITFKVYEFSELSEKAQEQVVKRYQKDAVFKNPDSYFNSHMKDVLQNDSFVGFSDVVVFDPNKLKIKSIVDGKLKLSPEGIKKDDAFMAMYGDDENFENIINAEYTVNYDGRNAKSVKLTTNDNIGNSGAIYYLCGVIGGTIEYATNMIKSAIENSGSSVYNVKQHVSDMLFHVDGSDLTKGEKMVVEERKLSD